MKNQHYGRSRLANMDMTPKEEHYRCPPGALPNINDKLDINGDIEIYLQTWEVQHKIVWFVIEQLHRPEPSVKPITIARIDCCLGMVHEHRFDRAGVDVVDHREFRHIPLDADPDFVNTAYTDAIEYAIDQAELNLEWWRRS